MVGKYRVCFCLWGRLAQLEEHLVYTEGVASSSLAPPTHISLYISNGSYSLFRKCSNRNVFQFAGNCFPVLQTFRLRFVLLLAAFFPFQDGLFGEVLVVHHQRIVLDHLPCLPGDRADLRIGAASLQQEHHSAFA